MYNNPVTTTGAILPATGMAMAIYWPLAGFALIMLGIMLVRLARTYRNSEE